LDFHTNKFQLRGIDLPSRASLARAPAANFQKYFFSQRLEKPIPNRRGAACSVAQKIQTTTASSALEVR